jgi:hypothetical protein
VPHKTEIMNHKESFKTWLPANGVNGKSIGSYISYLTSVEKALDSTIDELLKSHLNIGLERISNLAGKSIHTLNNYRTAFKKYNSFLKSQ